MRTVSDLRGGADVEIEYRLESVSERGVCSLQIAVEIWNVQDPAPKPITSPVPDSWYPTLSVFTLAIGLVLTASFFIYEATSSRKSRSLVQELTTGAVASVFLGFGSLFLLLASGVYV
ncbi:Transmembrane protein 258 [Glycine max]|nr:Transmembrane protein 258 [Glycine max]